MYQGMTQRPLALGKTVSQSYQEMSSSPSQLHQAPDMLFQKGPMTLKRLEQQQLTCMRQLNEEQRTFAFVMNKRLSQRGATRPQTLPSTSVSSSIVPLSIRGSRSAPAALATRNGANRVGSAKSANSRVKFEQSSSSLSPWSVKLQKKSMEMQDRDAREVSTVLKEFGASAGQRCCCECGHTRELLDRRLSCPAILQRHHS